MVFFQIYQTNTEDDMIEESEVNSEDGDTDAELEPSGAATENEKRNPKTDDNEEAGDNKEQNESTVQASPENETNVDEVNTATESKKKKRSKETNMVSVNANLLSDIFQICVSGKEKRLKMNQTKHFILMLMM